MYKFLRSSTCTRRNQWVSSLSAFNVLPFRFKAYPATSLIHHFYTNLLKEIIDHGLLLLWWFPNEQTEIKLSQMDSGFLSSILL
mmetsp:Transcript_34247/g.107274  ORF Transcript_34247/g.107274 Transcript_34247/m.107274 type:complete len:84 (-) Transcript_34247:196-447(-)